MRPDLDEVHAAAGGLGLAASDFGDRGLAEDLAQGGDALGPDATGLVGLLADLAVECLDDLGHRDLLRPARGWSPRTPTPTPPRGGGGGGAPPARGGVFVGGGGGAGGREELLEE